MKKTNIFLSILVVIFAFFTSTVSVFVAYAFFDNLTVTIGEVNLSIGEGFWSNHYVFAELDPENFNTTGIWGVNSEGFISNNGNVYIQNYKSQYAITSTARLGGDNITNGAYRIYFESTLNENNLIDGYALVFDNISASIKIVAINNGNVSQVLLTFNNSTNDFIALNPSNSYWRENQEIIIQVSESLTTGFKNLNVWVNNNQIVNDYLVNQVLAVKENVTGYFSYPLETTFIQMDISDYNSNIFTINFDSNGGTNVNSIREESGTLISAPTSPTREESTFIEWRLDGVGYIFDTMPSQNITLIAYWQVNQYTINFNSNGGSAVSSITQDFGTSVTTPTNPTRTGYTFINWYSDAGLTTLYTFDTMPNSNITLYAKWSINSYTINFDSNGGSTVSSISQNFGTTVSAPTSPTRNGYNFIEWTLSGSTYTFTTMPASNITLVAVWEELAANEYTITFDSNGGSAIASIVETEGNAISAPTSPTKTGYTFMNWYSDVALTTIYTFTIMPSQNITVYAKWTINSYTITFDSSGGSAVSPITGNYGTSVSAPTNPTRSGYLFVEWTFNSSPYTFTTMPASNITVIAVWEQIQFYTITFNSNGGSAVSSIVEQNGVTITAPTPPTKTGYTFNDWYSDAGLTVLYVFNTMPNSNITLYAKWSINSYTITFVTNGGSSISPATYNFGQSITQPIDPVKTGNYFFAGWYSDAKLTTQFNFGTMPAMNLNVFADWGSSGLIFQLISGVGYSVTGITSEAAIVQIPQRYLDMPVVEIGTYAFQDNTFIQSINIPYTLTTILDYAFTGVVAMQKIYIPINVTIIGRGAFQDCVSLTINVKATSKPAGWNNKWNISNLPVNWGVEFVPSILFNSSGGSAVSPITQEGGTSVSAPTSPTKTGHTFNGWYSDADFTTLYVFNLMPAQDTIVYAKWTINQYAITFDSNGGSAVSSIIQNFGTTVSAPTSPTRSGYLFVEWTFNSSPYTFTTMPDSNITLVAVWQELVANEYTITFDSNGGSTVSSIVEKEGSDISAPTPPTKTGYTFNDWYSDAGLTVLYVFNTMPNSNITLYAKWTINSYTITFVTNGGSSISPATYNFGQLTSAPANPVKTGNLFSGWYSDAKLKTQFVFGTMPANDLSIYADWGTTGLTFQLISGVGYRVVSGVTGLSTIQIPQRYQDMPVVEIGASAFANYTSLQYINIPYTLTTIGETAFANCSALLEVYIPINVTIIGKNAFKGCPSLTINVEATSKPAGWDSSWSKNVGTINWGVADD